MYSRVCTTHLISEESALLAVFHNPNNSADAANCFILVEHIVPKNSQSVIDYYELIPGNTSAIRQETNYDIAKLSGTELFCRASGADLKDIEKFKNEINTFSQNMQRYQHMAVINVPYQFKSDTAQNKNLLFSSSSEIKIDNDSQKTAATAFSWTRDIVKKYAIGNVDIGETVFAFKKHADHINKPSKGCVIS